MSLKSTFWKAERDYKKRKNGTESGIIYSCLYIQCDCYGRWWSCPQKQHQISDIQRNNQVFSLSLYVEHFIKTLCWLKIGADLHLLKSGSRREEKAIKVINLQDIHNSQGSFPWGRTGLQWWDLPCHLLKLLLWEFLKVRGNGLKTWKFTHLQNTMLGHVQIKFLETKWGKSIKKVYEDSSMPFHRLERQIKIIVKKKKEVDGGKIILPMPLDTFNSKTGNIVRSPTWQSPAPIDHPCSSQTVSHLLWFFEMNNIIAIRYQFLWEIYVKSVSKLYTLIY